MSFESPRRRAFVTLVSLAEAVTPIVALTYRESAGPHTGEVESVT